jgi:tRNA-specific 2-thiouridylase
VRFEQPQRALTPGQSIVLYDGDRVVAGGVIDRVEDA